METRTKTIEPAMDEWKTEGIGNRLDKHINYGPIGTTGKVGFQKVDFEGKRGTHNRTRQRHIQSMNTNPHSPSNPDHSKFAAHFLMGFSYVTRCSVTPEFDVSP